MIGSPLPSFLPSFPPTTAAATATAASRIVITLKCAAALLAPSLPRARNEANLLNPGKPHRRSLARSLWGPLRNAEDGLRDSEPGMAPPTRDTYRAT